MGVLLELLNIFADGTEYAPDESLSAALTGSDETLRRLGLRAAREAAEVKGSLGEDRDAWSKWWKANHERLLRGIPRQ